MDEEYRKISAGINILMCFHVCENQIKVIARRHIEYVDTDIITYPNQTCEIIMEKFNLLNEQVRKETSILDGPMLIEITTILFIFYLKTNGLCIEMARFANGECDDRLMMIFLEALTKCLKNLKDILHPMIGIARFDIISKFL